MVGDHTGILGAVVFASTVNQRVSIGLLNWWTWSVKTSNLVYQNKVNLILVDRSTNIIEFRVGFEA